MRSSLTRPRPLEGMEQAQPYTTLQPPIRPPHYHFQQAQPAPRPARVRPRLTPEEGWLAMILLAIAAYAVVISLLSAGWIETNVNLLFSTAVGLFVGLLVAKIRRFPQVILHLGACLTGHWLSVWLTSSVAYHTSWLLLLENLRSVLTGGQVASPVYDSQMVFLFYLTFLCFFLGYFGAWLIYRAHLPWLVALVYCSIMLVNLQYSKVDLTLLLVVLIGALLLLIARVQLSNQLAAWMQEGLHTDRTWLRSITIRFVQLTALMTIVILPLSVALPMLSQPAGGVALWNSIDNAWLKITHGQFSLNNPGALFQSGQGSANFFGDQLSITGSVNLPTGQVLSYTSTGNPQSHYLEGFIFDHFDGHTWTSLASGQYQSFAANTTLPLGTTSNGTRVTTSVTVVNPPGGTKSYIFAPAQPASFDVPISTYSDGATTAWTQQSPLNPGEQYHVVSFVPSFSSQQLSMVPLPNADPAAWTGDTNYVNFADTYLQIPDDLSPRVRETLNQWTSGATNTYDAMQALVAHFTDQTQFTYSVSNSPIPGNVDVVDWLLQTRRGYCTYYATAMTIMARLLGAPARIVNGFNQGHFDERLHVWEVDGTNAHSWVQVYFPNQGWVDFDPTPGFSLNNTNNPQPTPTAGQSPTPNRPQPTATTGHPAPGTHPTPSSNPGNTRTTLDASEAARNTLFLALSLGILLASMLILALAIYRYRLSKLTANIPIFSRAYWRLSRLASFSGSAPRESQTPYEYTRMLCQRYPRAQSALWHIAHLFVRERWGAPHHLPGEVEEKDLEQLWPGVRNTILRSWLSHFHRSKPIA